MKRTRFGSRDRLSRDAAELQRLATGLSESGGKLEDRFWEGQLGELVNSLLKNGAEQVMRKRGFTRARHRNADRAAKHLHALIEVTKVRVQTAKRVVRLEKARTFLNGFGVAIERCLNVGVALFVLRKTFVHSTKFVVRLEEIWIELDGLGQRNLRALPVLEFDEKRAKLLLIAGALWNNRDGLLNVIASCFELLLLHVHDAEIRKRFMVCRIDCTRALQTFDRFDRATLTGERDALVHLRHRFDAFA